ncbi:hypothetical protein [Microlunatus speluncae]|uniref:hypothetical protein n=1 Tax=Microlunatus speluncae TaxID=2594267 RepID=UPI0012664F8F|nr:hypothetical protein [Microlunatus speluncae]
MLIMIAVGFWVIGILITLSRTMIPYGFEAETVRTTAIQQEHQPGRDDMILIRTDRRTLRVDPNAAACVKIGDQLTKPAWSRDIAGPSGATCELGWPKQLRTVVVVPILVAAGCGTYLFLARLLLARRLLPRPVRTAARSRP